MWSVFFCTWQIQTGISSCILILVRDAPSILIYQGEQCLYSAGERMPENPVPTGLPVLATGVHPASRQHDWHIANACMSNRHQSSVSSQFDLLNECMDSKLVMSRKEHSVISLGVLNTHYHSVYCLLQARSPAAGVWRPILDSHAHRENISLWFWPP